MAELADTVLVFSSRAFTVDTIKKAAYRFSGAFCIDIVHRSDEIECVVRFHSGSMDDENVQRILRAFRTEVLDQDLRAIVARETEATRNAILGLALSKTGLQNSE